MRAAHNDNDLGRRGALLAWRYGRLDGEALLAPLITREFPGRMAVLSSFGAESALLLHMVARIDPATPVIFLDTGKLFPETLAYRDRLVAHLGLSEVRSVTPDPATLAVRDPDGTLWRRDPDQCCALRKVEPLARALSGFDALVSGRKRFQSAVRARLPAVEFVEGRVRISPLWSYSRERIEQEFTARGLPPHPLEAEGFLSIGCTPCTDRVNAGEDPRAGRWRGLDKTECGIHGTPRRSAGGVV
jgi:phosphoadenosine phosphosulfate reductase